METFKIYPNSIDRRAIDRIVEILHDGGIIIYPTDTLYAFGCDALNRRAIETLCRLKGLNPDKNLLSIACADISQASEYARIDNRAFQIIKNYLPGPFTFVMQPSTKLPKAFKGRKTVGIRVPDQPVAQAIAEALGNPLLTSSVNLPDDDPELAANPDALALHYANDIDALVDSDEGHLEASTIVDLSDPTDPQIIRQGLGQFDY